MIPAQGVPRGPIILFSATETNPAQDFLTRHGFFYHFPIITHKQESVFYFLFLLWWCYRVDQSNGQQQQQQRVWGGRRVCLGMRGRGSCIGGRASLQFSSLFFTEFQRQKEGNRTQIKIPRQLALVVNNRPSHPPPRPQETRETEAEELWGSRRGGRAKRGRRSNLSCQ